MWNDIDQDSTETFSLRETRPCVHVVALLLVTLGAQETGVLGCPGT